MDDLEKIIEFLKAVGKLKRIPRSGWLYKVNIRHPESVADHTFRTALFAMVYGDLKGLNSDKMVRMALLHDIAEAITGDLIPEEKSYLQRNEEDAAQKVFSYLPENLRKTYEEIWKEFELGASEEAQAVREIDKLEMVLQALEYGKEGYDKEKLEEFWKTTKAYLKSPDIKAVYKLIEKIKALENYH